MLLASQPSRDIIVAGHQQLTHEWWNGRREKFTLYVLEFVLEEIEQGDFDSGKKRKAFVLEAKILKRTFEALELAEALV